MCFADDSEALSCGVDCAEARLNSTATKIGIKARMVEYGPEKRSASPGRARERLCCSTYHISKLGGRLAGCNLVNLKEMFVSPMK